MDPKDVDLRAALLALLLSATWGANPIAIKFALAYAPPLRQAWMRFLLGGATVLLWAWWTGTRLRAARHEIAPLAILGLLFTVQIGLLNIGVEYTSGAHAVILVNTYTLHTVLLSHFFVPGDRMTPGKAMGVLLAYSGVIALFWPGLRIGAEYLRGDLILSTSALLLGVRTVFLNRAVQRIDPVKLLLAQVAVGVPSFFLLDLLVERRIPTGWAIPLLLSIGFQGVVVAGFNFICNILLLKVYRPSGLAAYYLTTPLFGVVASWLILGEVITSRLLVSALLVASGIGLASYAPGARPGVATGAEEGRRLS